MSQQRPLKHRALAHLTAGVTAGVLTALCLTSFGWLDVAIMGGWIAGCLVHCGWVWLAIRRLDGHQTEELAQSEDPGRGATTMLLLVAVGASLAGVAMLLSGASQHASSGVLEGLVGLGSVVGSWFLVHLLFTLRYAREFYTGNARGIAIGDEEQPDYQDFAYLAFCLGMTYQVSDQTTNSRGMRRLVMRHTLLSYGLGAVVLACSINLVVQLAG